MKSDPSVALRPNQDARNDDSDGGSSSEGVNSYVHFSFVLALNFVGWQIAPGNGATDGETNRNRFLIFE
jgi:hypothetical protein